MGMRMLTSDGDGGVVGAEDVELEAAEGVPEPDLDAARYGIHLEQPRPHLRFRRHLPSCFLAGDTAIGFARCFCSFTSSFYKLLLLDNPWGRLL